MTPTSPLSVVGAFLLVLCLPISEATAHGGGLDSMGCHHDRKHGGYHCHRGPLAGRSFNSKDEATRALQAQPPTGGPAVPGVAVPPRR